MARTTQTTLFEPAGGSPIGEATDWTLGMVFGEVAIVFGVLAVAFVGLTMLTGRLPLRDGLRVVVGLFVLLGAPVIAGALMQGTAQERGYVAMPDGVSSNTPVARELVELPDDPNPSASLRRD